VTQRLVKHGTEAGYNAERQLGNICDRCAAAHRVWSRRKGNKGKREGLGKYTSYDVIDHLDLRAKRPPQNASAPPPIASAIPGPRASGSATAAPRQPEEDTALPPNASAPPEPSLGDRLASRIRDLTIGGPIEPEYVEENDNGYVHTIEDTDDPGPGWEPADDVEFVITKQSLATIQENLGTYLSIVGMTAEMIDPYCGGAIAANFDNMVQKWSKVIAHYPKAANLFLDGTGGIIFTWIGAIQATWPVLYALYQHHLAKSIMVAPNGQIYRKGENPNNGQVVDALQPEFQYSAT
jgi:hypothetical protein